MQSVLEKFLSLRARNFEAKENKFHNSMIACSCEILFFIVNNNDLMLPALLELCSIDSYDFWTKIRFFIEQDTFLPSTLKEHFFEIEKLIVLIYSWKSDSFVSRKVLSAYENKESNNGGTYEIQEEFFFKRLLHLTAIQIQDLTDLLHLEPYLAESSWKLMKEILSKETKAFIGKNVVQFILSSIYSVCKMMTKSNPVTFAQIIMK